MTMDTITTLDEICSDYAKCKRQRDYSGYLNTIDKFIKKLTNWLTINIGDCIKYIEIYPEYTILPALVTIHIVPHINCDICICKLMDFVKTCCMRCTIKFMPSDIMNNSYTLYSFMTEITRFIKLDTINNLAMDLTYFINIDLITLIYLANTTDDIIDDKQKDNIIRNFKRDISRLNHRCEFGEKLVESLGERSLFGWQQVVLKRLYDECYMIDDSLDIANSQRAAYLNEFKDSMNCYGIIEPLQDIAASYLDLDFIKLD